MREHEILRLAGDFVFAREQRIRQSLGHYGAAGVIDDRRLAHHPADGRAVLEERVHPRIRMRIARRRGAVNCVATGVRAHVHHAHAVGVPSVNRLHVAMIERILPHHGAKGINDFRVGNLPVRLEPRGRVRVIFAAQAHHRVRDTALKPVVLVLATRLERLEVGDAIGFQPGGFLAQPRGFLVINRPHVSLGDRGRGAEHALFAATGAGAIAADERLVVAPHHEVIAQRRLARGLWRVVII